MAKKNPKTPKITDAEIRAAAAKLDVDNDEHWNDNGTAAMTAIEANLPDNSVTRQDVERACPDLSRTNPIAPEPTPEKTSEKQPRKSAERTEAAGERMVLFCTQNTITAETDVKRVPVAVTEGFHAGQPHAAVEAYNAQVSGGLPEQDGFGYQLCPLADWDGESPPDVLVVA